MIFFLRFFFKKSLEICSDSKVLFDFLIQKLFFFKFHSFSLLKGRQTPLSNSKSVKVRKNVIKF